MKDKIIQIRVTAEEHQEIKTASKKNGFDTVSTFMLYLYRANKKGDRVDLLS